MNGITDVAIVGAGPYGLSVAAHLRRSGLSVRQFGLPMHLWRANMPRGMFLKSQGFASNLSDPQGTLTLGAFCQATGHPYADYGLPVPLDTFVGYGQWFQAAAGLDVEEVLVAGVSPAGDGYELTLADGETLRARQVVVTVGVEHFAYLPDQLAALPADACTHSSAHTDLAAFAGQRVVVVGAGQSALESAALLHEHGAQVQIVMREDKVAWNGAPLPPERPLLQRLREPEAGLGSGLGHLVLLHPAGHVPAPARGHPGHPGADRARPGRGELAARPGRGRDPGSHRPRAGLGAGRARRGPARPGPWPGDWQRGGWWHGDWRHGGAHRAGRRSRHRGHRLPAGPEPADVPGRGAAVPAAHRGRHPRGGRRLPDQRARAVRGGPGGGSHVRPGHAVRVRRGPRGTDRGPAPGRLGHPPRRSGRGGRPVSVSQTGERAWAAGPGERSVGVSVGHANVPASPVSVPQTGERAWAAGPGERSVGVSVGTRTSRPAQ